MSSFLVLPPLLSSTVSVFASLLLERVFHLPSRIGVIGVPSMTPPSALNSMVPPNTSFFVFFFWASRSGAHLPMIFASIPEGPRKNKNQPTTLPRQQQLSSITPATLPMMMYIFLLLFFSAGPSPPLAGAVLVVRLGAGASSSAAGSTGGGGGSA